MNASPGPGTPAAPRPCYTESGAHYFVKEPDGVFVCQICGDVKGSTRHAPVAVVPGRGAADDNPLPCPACGGDVYLQLGGRRNGELRCKDCDERLVVVPGPGTPACFTGP